MYRVVIPCLAIGIALTGCSMGTSAITSGFNAPVRKVAAKRELSPSRALGRKTSGRNPSNRKFASLGKDAAPKGSYSKARRGALAARNFTGVRLDLDKARKLINNYRKARGLKTLRVDVQLTDAAKAHSRDLARWDRISHYGSDGSNPWDRVKRTGYNAKLAAENVGTGQNSIEEVFKGWQKSPGHNKNLLLADAKQMGIALVYDPNTEFKTFWTLVIGTKL